MGNVRFAHRGMDPQAVGIVHVFAVAQSAENELSQQGQHRELRTLSASAIRQHCASLFRQTEFLTQFTKRNKPASLVIFTP